MKELTNRLNPVTKRRVRTFPLLTCRTMFTSVIQPRFLTLQTVTQPGFLPVVSKVFKKGRATTNGFSATLKQQRIRIEPTLTFAPNVSFNYVAGGTNIQNTTTTPGDLTTHSNRSAHYSQPQSLYQHQELLKKFTSHFTLLFSQSKDYSTVVQTTFAQLGANLANRRTENGRRFDPSINNSYQNQSLVLIRPQSKLFSHVNESQRSAQHLNRLTSTASHDSPTYVFGNYSPSINFATQLNRNFVIGYASKQRPNELFKTHELRTVLNKSAASSQSASRHISIYSPVSSFSSMALQLVLPKFSQTQQVEQRIAQFMSRPEMIHVKVQQNSNENIVEVLRQLQKQQSTPPPIPTPQFPSIEQLTNQVRTQLERELRIERERRGI